MNEDCGFPVNFFSSVFRRASEYCFEEKLDILWNSPLKSEDLGGILFRAERGKNELQALQQYMFVTLGNNPGVISVYIVF